MFNEELDPDSQVDRDILFMSAYPNAMTGFQNEQLRCDAERWMSLTSCGVHDHSYDWEPFGHGGG